MKAPAAALLLLAAAAARAEVAPGELRLEAGEVTPRVTSWGPDCGPAEPRPETDPPGTIYQLAADGTLVAGGRARPLFAPGICAAASGLRGLDERRSAPDVFRCASPPQSAKSVRGEIRAATDDPNRIEITQVFDYDWRLKGSHCVVRLEGRWRLVRTVPLAPVDACASPGPPARVQISGRPLRAVRADGKLRLEARVEDAQGCALSARPDTWTASAGEVDIDGVFTARGLAAGTRATVTAGLDGAERATWTVVVAAADAGGTLDETALLAAAPDLPRTAVAPLPPQAGEGVAAASGRAAIDEPGSDRLLLIVFIAFGVVAAGLGVLVAWRTLRGRARPVIEAPVAGIIAAESATAGRSCPRCGTAYGPDARFCGRDGAGLVDQHRP